MSKTIENKIGFTFGKDFFINLFNYPFASKNSINLQLILLIKYVQNQDIK